jgi:Na+-driven multidrug efflux pump
MLNIFTFLLVRIGCLLILVLNKDHDIAYWLAFASTAISLIVLTLRESEEE